jgi:hypothetical protein
VGNTRWVPILHLGRPQDSVVVEAYRHLVDPVELDTDADREAFMTDLVPRALLTCTMNVTCLLGLRTDLGRNQAGLTVWCLTLAPVDRDAYGRCQHVSQAAHESGRHGIIAPAATGMGETLAHFVDVLPTRGNLAFHSASSGYSASRGRKASRVERQQRRQP